MTNTSAIDQVDQPGRVTWHSSEEDGGPDVGLSFGLGDGSSLYVGEISRRAYEDAAAPLAACGSDRGWWVELHKSGGSELIGKLLGYDEGRALIDTLQAAWNRRSTPTASAPSEAVAQALEREAARLKDEAQIIHNGHMRGATEREADAFLRAAGIARATVVTASAPSVPEGWPTPAMVTAGANEVANYYDDGNDQRHREVARFTFRATLSAAPSPAAQEAGWLDISEAPEAPGRIDVRSVTTYRWLAYKKTSDQYRRGIKGRWQRATDHGWENADLPVDGEWRPNVAASASSAGEG